MQASANQVVARQQALANKIVRGERMHSDFMT